MRVDSVAVARAGLIALLLGVTTSAAGAVPEWLRAQAAVTIPTQDPKTNAVVLYDETVATAAPNGRVHYLQRRAIRILRADGEGWGMLRVNFDDQTRITNLRAWSLPEGTKPFEVTQKQAIETALFGVENGELVSDLRTLVLAIPAAVPGSVIGYEWEQDELPYLPLTNWNFQETIPVLKSRFALKLPPGWGYRTSWLNHPAVEPMALAQNQWQWSIDNLPAVRIEAAMPPWRKIAGHMSLELVKDTDAGKQSMGWADLANWYSNLARGRQDATPEIRQKVAELTGGKATTLDKMNALARFVQTDIRYVAIELGIGGFQPHSAAQTFLHRYGDCKDKATLLASMLRVIGIESHYVLVNTERGAVNDQTAPNLAFDHVILAIVLPEDVKDGSLLAVERHQTLGSLLYFDPTQSFTPLGRVDGSMQASHVLLVTPNGGELMRLPQLASSASYVRRNAQLKLNARGDLSGDLQDVRTGDAAAIARYGLRLATQDSERIQPVEHLLADSITNFSLQRASVVNLRVIDQPFEWRYSFEAPGYAKITGDLMMVRPWVLGSYSSGLLETKDPRQHSVEFDGPALNGDTFEIELPDGYVVDALPAPTNIDIGFLSYQSKTEVAGRKIRFVRTLEVKQLAVPAASAQQLKQFYRSVYSDERRVAVLKRAGT